MKKVCYIISGIDKALAFEWIWEQVDKSRFELHFVLLHHKEGGLADYLKEQKAPLLHIPYASKKDFPKAVYQIYHYLKRERIEIAHTHLLDAGLAGLIAARFASVKQRIYTRHHSSYHHVYHRKGVLYDRLTNLLSTKVIAISEVVRKVLVEWEHCSPSKVQVVHHGFPLANFENVEPLGIAALKSKYTLSGSHPVIGVVSRYTEWKGIQYIIPAFQRLLERYPKSMLVLANAKGEYAHTIQSLLTKLPAENYREIKFEDDLYSLFHCFDVFVHTPIDWHSEAFGQVYVEAMAAGIPSVFTLSGIANEIAVADKNCVLAAYQSTESIYQGLIRLIEDTSLRQNLSDTSKQTVNNHFELERMIRSLENLYE